jgi:hypothetical protein
MDWYLSPRVFDEISIIEISEFIKKKDQTEWELLIINEAEKLIPVIIQNCSQNFETRRSIFEEIEKAFENEMYHSVVVLAYTQADGICNDNFQNGFFDKELISSDQKKKRKKNPTDYQLTTYRKIKNFEMNHSISVVEQLDFISNEITAYSDQGKLLDPDIRKTSFNRHLVLHGHSKEFGTKVNALRAICLLDFLHFIISEVISDDENN